MIDGAIPLDPGAARAIVEAAHSLRDDAVDQLASLVRHRSVLGHEQSCLDEMERAYADLGLVPFRIPIEPERLSGHAGWSPPLIPYDGREPVVAIHRPLGLTKGRSLMLQGHVDVVPEGAADLWTTPPFEPSVRDGRMYGRGAADMKAGIVASLMALRALHLAGLQPAAELQMAAVIEEECTGNGALAVMTALGAPDACLIPEPGPGFPALYVAEVGVVWAWVTVTGKPVHVRDMQAGVNAVEAAMAIAARFKPYEAEMNAAQHRHPAFAADNHPVNVNVGSFEGGEWTSSVPTRATFSVRVGVMPGKSCREVAREIEALVAGAAADVGAKAQVAFRGFMADGCVFAPEQPISRLAAAAHLEATGRELRPYAATGLTDARHYALYQSQTQATCYGPDSDAIHGIDESVGLESMHEVTTALALLIASWCGVE